jgi:hypothetical protein
MFEIGPEEVDSRPAEVRSLEELAHQLERDPEECFRAFEGLESIDSAARVRIIQGLGQMPGGPGVASLLRLLIGSDDAATREAARLALTEAESNSSPSQKGDPSPQLAPVEIDGRPRLEGCLVTAVDGAGRGSIAVSASLENERRTAVFLCDVLEGIVAVVGQIEQEGPEAGGLLNDVRAGADGLGVLHSPELGLGLLAGNLAITAPEQTRQACEWLDQTVGDTLQPWILPAPSPEPSLPPPGPAELLARAGEVLDACPDWLDRSPLTLELAEEIWLREGRTAADPTRDAGAFRYLFQHRLIHRLELYRRMLLWMAWFWRTGDDPELARGAAILAGQLSDEQHAVPANPFAVVLMARSLDEAGELVGARGNPRAARREGESNERRVPLDDER